MVNPIAWIHSDEALTYPEANALAASLGGRLLVLSDGSGPVTSLTSLRDVLHHEEDPVWVNGGPNPPNYLPLEIQDVLVEYVGPTANPDPSSPLAPASVRGTAGNDQFLGGPGSGFSLRAGAGDDLYIGGGGGTIDLGPGNDTLFFREVEASPWGEISLENVGPTLIYDGDGADYIRTPSFGGSTVLSAAIDGDNDTFLFLTRLSYGSDTAGIRAIVSGPESAGTASGVGIGTDSLGAIHEIVGGSGNDHIEGFARIQGGAGNDYLAPTSYAEGGAGNDTMVTSAERRVELRAEAGNDTLLLRHSAKVSGGSGSDHFTFAGGSGVTIGDFAAGDYLDLSAITDLTVAELFSTRTLQLRQDGGYTDLLFDSDGASGPNGAIELATLKGVFTQAFLDDWVVT
jgi:hypothetical protein